MTLSEMIAVAVGLPEDQIRLVLASLLCVPLCYLMPSLPQVQLRRLYSTLLGVALQLYVYNTYRPQLAMMLLVSLAVYAAVRVRPRTCGR